jgi:hypothetical protein
LAQQNGFGPAFYARLVEAGKRDIGAITPAKEECNKLDMIDAESPVHCELLSACMHAFLSHLEHLPPVL